MRTPLIEDVIWDIAGLCSRLAASGSAQFSTESIRGSEAGQLRLLKKFFAFIAR
jgi:hypothetical protein